MIDVHHGDCLAILPTLADNSIDAIITDPPYHLVRKSRGGSPQPGDLKTPYGRHGPSKARSNHGRPSDGPGKMMKGMRSGFHNQEWDGGDIAFRTEVWSECLRVLKPGGYLAAFGSTRTGHRLACAIEDAGFEIADCLGWVHAQGFPKSLNVAKAIQSKLATGNARFNNSDELAFPQQAAMDAPGAMWMNCATGTWSGSQGVVDAPEAAQWLGFGTALKPAWEQIYLAQKPRIGTYAENVLAYGTGALNIDGCRLPTGRWPANLAHDGSDEVVDLFPRSKSCDTPSSQRCEGTVFGGSRTQGQIYPGEDGSAARFFYCAKASKKDRCGSKHPTVKPVALMEWLAKLITPPGGRILDPFAGSGTTGQAARNCGFDVILIERELEYVTDIRKRFEMFDWHGPLSFV